jgi:mono/diheme cytochrome c family protein
MSEEKKTEEAPNAGPYGLLAEYENHTDLIAAAKTVRDEGIQRWDCYSPFPVHGIDPAMGIKPTRLPWIVLIMGMSGTATALLMQWWTNGYDYPWVVSGKPYWSIPANIPITFELTVLFAALTAFFSMLVMNGLPKPSSPLDRVSRFARASDDRFFVVIEASDPKYDDKDTRELLAATQAVAVEEIPDDRSSASLPKAFVFGAIILIAVSLIPFGFFTEARAAHPRKPQWHIVPNMDFQKYYKPQRANEFFADSDGRAMRLPVEGTVAVGQLRSDDHLYRGKENGTWALTLPHSGTPTAENMARGREGFGIYCAPCHGELGDGDGMVHRRAFALKEGTWVKPSDLAALKIRQQPIGELFNTITNGIRNMPAYGEQIPAEDRWRILLYLRALQRSQAVAAAPAPAPAQAQATEVTAAAVTEAGPDGAPAPSVEAQQGEAEAATADQAATRAAATNKVVSEPAPPKPATQAVSAPAANQPAASAAPATTAP